MRQVPFFREFPSSLLDRLELEVREVGERAVVAPAFRRSGKTRARLSPHSTNPQTLVRPKQDAVPLRRTWPG